MEFDLALFYSAAPARVVESDDRRGARSGGGSQPDWSFCIGRDMASDLVAAGSKPEPDLATTAIPPWHAPRRLWLQPWQILRRRKRARRTGGGPAAEVEVIDLDDEPSAIEFPHHAGRKRRAFFTAAQFEPCRGPIRPACAGCFVQRDGFFCGVCGHAKGSRFSRRLIVKCC